jgi:GNAT superfamily N-acetyltransferase
MRFLSFDELSSSMEPERLLIHLASLGGAADRRAIDVWRRRSTIFADYVGVFAVERGHVLGQTFVKRLPYAFPDGSETIGGVASVGTRPDLARHGVARGILEEVHRREREAGIRFVTLWTNRSWGAHRLYESLGYRDIHPVPWAVRPPRASPASGRPSRAVRTGRASDLPELDRLHDRLLRGRLGFSARPPRTLETLATTGDLDPAARLLVATSGRSLVGYASVQVARNRALCDELVGSSVGVRRALVTEVERRSNETTVAFCHSAVHDLAPILSAHGYSRLREGWYAYLAAEVGRAWSVREAVARFATHDPRFVCMAADRF